MRRIVLAVIILLVIIGGIVWFFSGNEVGGSRESSVFSAIPTKTPLLIEFPDADSFLDLMSGDNPIVSELKSVSDLQSYWTNINDIVDLGEHYPSLDKIIRNKSILVALNFEGKSSIGSLFVFRIKSNSEANKLIEVANSISASDGMTLTKRDYADTEIYTLNDNEVEYHFAIKDYICLFSSNDLFVEEAIRQISADNLLDNDDFNNLFSNVSSGADMNIFINHENIPQFLKKLNARTFNKSVEGFSSFASWTELNAQIEESGIYLDGVSLSSLVDEDYLDIFKNQGAVKFSIDKMLPSGTSFFLNLNLDDYDTFQTNLEEYLKKQGTYYTRETNLTKLDRYCSDTFLEEFQEVAGNSYTVSFGQVLQNEPTLNRFFIAEVKNQSSAREMFLPILERYNSANELSDQENQYTFETTQKDVYTIYRFPFKNLAELIMGKSFSAVDCNYISFYKDFLVFADNRSALEEYIKDIEASETLAKDQKFQEFNDEMDSHSNFYFYLNFQQSYSLRNYYLKENIADAIKDVEGKVNKFYALGWQFSMNEEKINDKLYLKYNPYPQESPQLIWQTKLDDNVSVGPQIVLNHKDSNANEVILQDENNNLYLVNSNGEINWKLSLSSQIIGEINQVDIYRNGKFQYLFNTKDQLYLIDRNGDNVGKYPVKLKSPATNGVSVVDYDNNRNYRFFIACDNKQVYVYNNDGSIVTGWAAGLTDGTVSTPIKHFRVQSKDYIAFNDQTKTYLLDRQGNVRVDVVDSFNHSNNESYLVEGSINAVATTDTDGKVHLQYFDGTSEQLDLGDYSDSHYFVADDLNYDGNTDFLIADDDEVVAYSQKGKKLFDFKLDDRISGMPHIYSINGTEKIVVVSDDDNQVNLIDTSGNLYTESTLKGTSFFDFGSLNPNTNSINLLTGDEDGNLLNHKIY